MKKWSVLYTNANGDEFNVEIDCTNEPSVNEVARTIIVQHGNSRAIGDFDTVDYMSGDPDRLQKEMARLGYKIVNIRQL